MRSRRAHRTEERQQEDGPVGLHGCKVPLTLLSLAVRHGQGTFISFDPPHRPLERIFRDTLLGYARPHPAVHRRRVGRLCQPVCQPGPLANWTDEATPLHGFLCDDKNEFATLPPCQGCRSTVAIVAAWRRPSVIRASRPAGLVAGRAGRRGCSPSRCQSATGFPAARPPREGHAAVSRGASGTGVGGERAAKPTPS
jgi:hypothetical protein